MKCQRCKEESVAKIFAKCSDCFAMTWPSGENYDGYVPPRDKCGIGSGDCVAFHYCLSCGQIQGTWPPPGYDKNDHQVGDSDEEL